LRKKKKKKKTEETHPTLTRMIALSKECQPKSQKWIQLVLPNPIASFSSKATKLKTRTK